MRCNMTNREAKEVIERLFLDSTNENYPFTEEFGTACRRAIDVLYEAEWIPFLFDKDGYFCCETPYEYDEILVSSLGNVWQDTWICACDEDGNLIEGLESNIELVGLAWKPMPKPWEGNKK